VDRSGLGRDSCSQRAQCRGRVLAPVSRRGVFVVHRGEHPEPRVPPEVADRLDVPEHRVARLSFCPSGWPVDELLLPAAVEALHRGVVKVVALAAHRDARVDAAAALGEDQRRVLGRSLALTDGSAALRLAARGGHLERIDDELSARVVSHRPADDPAAAVAVHHACEVPQPSHVRMYGMSGHHSVPRQSPLRHRSPQQPQQSSRREG
jgi:hypothetical protein